MVASNQQESQQSNEERGDKLNLDVSNQKIDVEFQKWMTDVDGVQKMFNQALCGWRYIITTSTRKEMGDTIIDKNETLIIDYNSRVINEAGASYVCNQVKLMISPLTSTSKLNEIKIFKMVRYKVKNIRHNLLTSYYIQQKIQGIKCNVCNAPNNIKADYCFNCGTPLSKKLPIDMIIKNPYEINIYRLSDITTLCIEIANIMAKADEGFTLEKLASSFITSNIIRSGNNFQQQEDKGLWGKAVSYISGNKR